VRVCVVRVRARAAFKTTEQLGCLFLSFFRWLIGRLYLPEIEQLGYLFLFFPMADSWPEIKFPFYE
jgi:hypothetical protein